MERDMARHTPDQAGHVNLANSNIKIEAVGGLPATPVANARIVSYGGNMERDVARQMPDDAGHVILDNDNMKIEELRGPDHLDQQGKGKKQLKEYLEEGTIKPVTGDQVVYRLKQAGNAPEGTDAGGGRDTSAAQVAVLGSPTVPLGLSSALGYLHLGQVARIKVPPHLMQQGAADDTGEVAPRAPPAATAASSRSAGSFKVWMDNSSSGGTVGSTTHAAAAAAAAATSSRPSTEAAQCRVPAAASGAASSSSTPRRQQQQQQGSAAQASSSKAAEQQQQQQQQDMRYAGAGGGSFSDAATYGSNADAGGGGDGRGSIGGDAAEYELEVLAIVPGRGKLSGQPVLSDAARQQQRPLDIPALTQDTPNHLQPPKPLRGMSGWVRRHLSLNVRAPWKAGKRGLGWLGLRGCCKGQGKQKEDEQAQQRQQKPAYGSDA